MRTSPIAIRAASNPAAADPNFLGQGRASWAQSSAALVLPSLAEYVVVPPLEVRVGSGGLEAGTVADSGQDVAYLVVGQSGGVSVGVEQGYGSQWLG